MHATLFPNPAQWMDPRKLLASGAAALLLLLNLHCGGGATATVAGPPPLTLTVEAPGEGVVVPSAALRLRGRVSQASATVAINRQAVAVQPDGAFEGSCQLQEGRNTLTIEAWTEATVREGRGSGLLPPSERAEARVIRTVAYERPPLLLTVAVPAEGATFTTPTLQTTGVVSEPDATLTLNGQPVPLGPEGAFSATVDLQIGTNTFTYRATGAGQADRTATATRTVTRQTLPPGEGPTVTLTEPVEGTLTNAARIRVSGRVSDPSAALQVNGQATPMDATGAFSLDLAPPEGPLTVTAVATNTQGLTGSDRRSVVIDRTPPVITLARPVPALVNTRTLDLEGRVDDPTALLTLNAQGIPLASEGAFQARYGLAEGPNHLAFRAVDPAGNVGTLELDTVCDSVAPGVTLETPPDGWISNQRSVVVKGRVDDPEASLLVAGKSLKPSSDGTFEVSLSPAEGSSLIVALATDPAGNTGHATRGITLDWTPPTLAWTDPTPGEGSLLARADLSVKATVSESATVTLNGQPLDLKAEPRDGVPAPFWVGSGWQAQDGPIDLVLEARDRAGNGSRLERSFNLGAGLPIITFQSPAEGAQAPAASATLTGRVESDAFLNPVALTINGQAVAVGADGAFSASVDLAEGVNTFQAVAVNRFGGRGQAVRTLHRYTTPFGIQIEWPLDGLATPETSTLVRGRVLRPGTTVAVNGIPALVDATALTFSATVPLQAGLNTLTAEGRDGVGNAGQAQVRVTSTPALPQEATYRWELPAPGSASRTRVVRIQGRADLPGVCRVQVNGQPMRLIGEGHEGRFEGDLALEGPGRTVLRLEVGTMAGRTFTEQREVSFVPDLPRIRLLAPDAARPGDLIPLQVVPEPGTRLVKADLLWNGRLLASVVEPFAAVQAQVPADAAVGGRMSVEALGTDDEGAIVTARTSVAVYGQGALMVEAYDDRLGLPFTDRTATAAVEGGETQALDARGRAALSTALPQSWVKVTKPGFTPVWRAAGLTVGALQAVVDARLTALEPARSAGPSGLTGPFGGGALNLSVPAGALASEASLSVTPLSTQGLPALLPLGWSPLSAWWFQIDGAALAAPATASLVLPPATPALPAEARFAWVRWDEATHVWVVLAAQLTAATLDHLSLPANGGYALVLADPAPTAPPQAVPGSPLPAFQGRTWEEGLAAAGSVDPAVLPTVEAIRGARATARFGLAFADGRVVPSGTPIQAEVLESYALLDESLIEPEGFGQDAVATRWVLEVVEGKPSLSGIPEGIGLRLPLRMSRTFGERDLVEGRIFVAFYHDGVRVAESGSGLLGASGGTVTREGVTVSIPAGGLSGTTLIRLTVDGPGAEALWPELADRGRIAASFGLDIVGTLRAGFGLSLETLEAPENARLLLAQRRVVQGQRLVVVVGEVRKEGAAWNLILPPGGNPILEGGAFAVLVPDQAWDWVSGTALLPGSLAQPLMRKLGAKARMAAVAPPKGRTASTRGDEDVAVADVVVEAGHLSAVSGAAGAFAVPARLPEDGSGAAVLKGSRWDLGVTGTLSVPIPSAGQALRLAAVPFRVLTVLPAERAEVGVGSIVEVLLSTAADPATLGQTRLYAETQANPVPPSPAVERPGAPAARTGEAQSPRRAAGQTLQAPSRVAKPSGKPAAHLSRKPAATPSRRPSAHPASIPSGASDPSGWVEVPVRRSLSLDGRTLTLTPETALAPGTLYRAVAQGLASLSGETAPAFTRHFKTQPQAQLADVDLARIHLSYPTEAFAVTVAIPEGAVPAWSLVEVEAQLMGSHGQGVMPPSGSLAFQLKASLGERLKVTVQTRDGRTVSRFIGRYVAPDGRTTLGQDGGRVEGPGGLAVVVPEGALEAAVELRVEALNEAPAPAEGALVNGEAMVPALRLSASQPVDFRKVPVIELPAGLIPPGADTAPSPAFEGNGPLALFRQQLTVLPDGSTDEAFVLMDTAEVRREGDAAKVVSLGGLRVPDAEHGIRVQGGGLPLKGIGAGAGPEAHRLRSGKGSEQAPLMGLSSFAFVNLYLLSQAEAVEPQYRYHSGTVYRNWNGSGACGGQASATCYGPLGGAEVHRYKGATGLDEARRGRLAKGRLLAVADPQGRYLNVGGPMAEVIPGQSWIALFAVDPRTGETSIDPGAVPAASLGLPFERRNHSIAITSTGGNPFDPSLTAPRLRAQLVDGDGLARTMFARGEQATLRIFTEPGSQAVVRGKVSGALTQDLGALPAEIPVTFSQEGTWRVDLLGWTAKPVEGRASLSAIVTPPGELGPSQPGRPRIQTLEPAEGERDVDPSAIVRLTFTEPVRITTAPGFHLKVNGTDIPFTVVSNGRDVTDAATWVQGVWLVPAQRLGLGATVSVGVTQGLQDRDGEPMVPQSWSFTIRGADEVGSLVNPGTFTDMVVNRGTLYAVEDVGEGYTFDGQSFLPNPGARRHAIRMIDVSDPSRPRKGAAFGAFRSWEPPTAEYTDRLFLRRGPFNKSSIHSLRVATGVSIGGRSRDVLLVATRPWQTQEVLVALDPEYGGTTYKFRHSALYAFDITGDADSFEPSMGQMIPKLLMATSQGTMSENWIKGLGSAGGVLGSIRLRGGMTLWDADRWKGSWDADTATLSDWTIRYRTGDGTGYYANPGSVVASNGFYNQTAGSRPSVTSAVISEDENGRPIGFATMGWTNGILTMIDGRVGEPESKATFMSGGPQGMDGRLRDLTPAVGGEAANFVEVLKGTWQGTNGTEQGTLLLVGTQTGTANHFWVLKTDLSDPKAPTATPLGKALLPGRIARIQTDAKKMLVGVEAGGRVLVFDLKSLQPTQDPAVLTPIHECLAGGGWTLDQGMLLQTEGTAIRRLVVKNLDGVTITPKLGIPLLVDANQFFAGAFYDYNRSVLGDYNPPPQPQMPEKLVYALTDMQGKNGGYPMLRHHYPDLGEMHISGVVNLQDPKQFLEATGDDSPWFMEAEAKLYDGNAEVPDAVTIEALTISEDQRKVTGNGTRRSKVFGNGLMARAELSASRNADGLAPTAPWQEKFAYAPFKFFLKPEVLTRLDQEMRLDFKERFRIQVQMKLYKDERQRALGTPEATLKTYEFAVKFNSNTRLFDVLRGGVWYFDPVVASKDPSDTAQNPFTAEWLKRLVDAKGKPVDVEGIFRSRLSLTPGTVIQKGTNYNGVVFGDDMVAQGENGLAWIGLDMVQRLMENLFPKLRRQIFEDQRNTRMTPIAQRFRSLFSDAPLNEKGLVDISRAAEAYGAFGYRMAHALNSVQMFTKEEVGIERSLDKPNSWSTDPTRQQGEKDSEGRKLDARIRPLVNQHIKNDQNYNPGNVLVNYLVAYPKIRTINPQMDANGLYPINTMFTRDLAVGPMGLSSNGERFHIQREAIDQVISMFGAFPSPNDSAFKLDSVHQASIKLTQALMDQQIVTDAGAIKTGKGDFYTKGVGLIQASMQEKWHPSPMPQDPDYKPGAWNNQHLYAWAENIGMDYDDNPAFNGALRLGIMDHLLKHLGSNRADVYVNGVQNTPEELEASSDALQQQLDKLEGRTSDPEKSRHIPVIGVYNTSAKRYFGGNDNNDLFDAGDMMKQKHETAQPEKRTENGDAIKLIGALKALVQVVWSRDFELAFFRERLKNTGFPQRIWVWGPDGPVEQDLVADIFAKNAVYADGAWRDFVEVTAVAPKTKDTLEEEFPADPSGRTPDQVLAERRRLFDKSAAAFLPKAVVKRAEIHRALMHYELTLHAHSQGAVVSSVAHSRLGEVPVSRSISAESCKASKLPEGVITGDGTVDVAKAIHFVSYGGAANMYDWGTKPYFKSYAHHVNERDVVVVLFGMYDPFQTKLRKVLTGASLSAAINWNKLPLVSWAAKHSAATDAIVNDPLNPHFIKVLSGPSQALRQTWDRGDHAVIFHNSNVSWNADEHNFVRGFVCNVGKEKYVSSYPKRSTNVQTTGTLNPMYWIWWLYEKNPNVVTGEDGCLAQSVK